MEILSSPMLQISLLNGLHPPLPFARYFVSAPYDITDAELEEEGGGGASPPSPPRLDITVSWRPPPDGWIKLNTDGSFVGRDSSGGAGFVARDSEGLFVFAGASSCPGVNPLFSELWAIRSALIEAIKAGFPRVILESDSSSAVHLLGGGIKNAPRRTKQLVQECITLRCCFCEIIVQFTYREGNRVADRLAALGRRWRRARFFSNFDELADSVARERIAFDF